MFYIKQLTSIAIPTDKWGREISPSHSCFFSWCQQFLGDAILDAILTDCNGTRTHNHSVRKWTLNYLAKLTKWLSWIVGTYLCGAFDCMFLSCHTRVFQSESTKVNLIKHWILDIACISSASWLKTSFFSKISWFSPPPLPNPPLDMKVWH